MMTKTEEELMLHMFEKNEALKAQKLELEEKNAELEDEVTAVKNKATNLFKAVQAYDFVMHEFECMLKSAGASTEAIGKLRDRGLANVRP